MTFSANPVNLQFGQQLAQATRLFDEMKPMQLETGIQFSPMQAMQPSKVESFQSVLANSLGSVNEAVKAPEALMHEAMSGGPVDIHDVVMASTKSELAVSMTTTSLTKIVQAYDRITQIQI